MSKRRSAPALAANLRRAEQSGKTKKDIIEEYSRSWRKDAELAIEEARAIAKVLAADVDDCECCDNGWELDRWGNMIPCRFCVDEECRG